jgi:hypothetical protein
VGDGVRGGQCRGQRPYAACEPVQAGGMADDMHQNALGAARILTCGCAGHRCLDQIFQVSRSCCASVAWTMGSALAPERWRWARYGPVRGSLVSASKRVRVGMWCRAAVAIAQSGKGSRSAPRWGMAGMEARRGLSGPEFYGALRNGTPRYAMWWSAGGPLTGEIHPTVSQGNRWGACGWRQRHAPAAARRIRGLATRSPVPRGD